MSEPDTRAPDVALIHQAVEHHGRSRPDHVAVQEKVRSAT